MIKTKTKKEKQPTKKEVKEHIGLRASKEGIDNCNKIAQRKEWTFSYAVSKAMEAYNPD